MANTTLTRTFGTPSSTKTGTFSFWLKNLSSSGGGVFNNYGDANNRAILYISNSQIDYYDAATGTSISGTPQYRDPNGWYHVVLRIDTTQSSANDRTRVYVNGALQEATYGHTYNLNENSYMFTAGTPFVIGRDNSSGGSGDHLNAVISHFHYCDGQSYAPTVFGSVDSVTGEWQINTAPSMTMGNQGFTILKDGNTITDQSANSNNFSLGSGAITKTQDCPSNVFATLNPLDNFFAQNTFSYGNTRQLTDNSRYAWSTSTLGMTSGKYYCEVRHSGNIGDNYPEIGIAGRGLEDTSTALGTVHNTVSYQYNGQILINGTASSFGSAYSSTAIIGIALDVTNSKIYFSLNGVWQGSGNPTTGANGKTITTVSTVRLGAYFFAGGDYGNSSRVTFDWNFGNGYFNSTAVSSAGTNASGNGIFEHDVPTGFTALSTKGLNL